MSKNIENVLITSDGIKNSLKRYKPLQALAEYVWNGFDAHASHVEIEIEGNVLSGNARIIVVDNGDGIDRDLLSQKFKPFFQSEKVYDPTVKHSATHGKNGVGRLTFFTFANFAHWETMYIKDGEVQSYSIDIDSTTLQNYASNDRTLSIDQPGTKVIFEDVFDTEITVDTLHAYLAQEFCWFLELNRKKGFAIYINGKRVDYHSYITAKETIIYKYPHSENGPDFNVRYICWSIKLSEYSKYYYIKSDGQEVGKENTTLNNKGDRFYHSVYIQSPFFDTFDTRDIKMHQTLMQGFSNKKSDEYTFIMHEVNRHLYDMRRPFIKDSVSKIVDSLEIESAFPKYDPNNLVYKFRVSQISEMVSTIYIAQPKIFTSSMNKEQKKTFIRLLDLILETGEVDALFNILNEVLDMSEDERHDLSDILKYTHLSNVTKTIKLIQDRYQAINDLKQLVFNADLHANEVKHLQQMVENHYWIFGEQYNLVTAAEPNFEEALRRYLRFLHEEYEDASITHPDKLKQMDIFAVRQDMLSNKIDNIVVELKHPHIAIGEKQLSQVKKYMRVILSTDDFNGSNMTWSFYLIGNKFSNDGYIEGELETNKSHGEPFLVYKTQNYKIFVMRWSEVFADFELRHDFLNERLNIERGKLQRQYDSADAIIDAQSENTATAPEEMSPT